MCQIILQSAEFFALLLLIDIDLAVVAKSQGCHDCQGTLHQAHYPRWFAAHQEDTLSKTTDPSSRDRWARLRFSIIGHLLAAPPEVGELHRELAALAAKT